MLARLRNKLRFLFRGDRFDREIAEEMDFHREMLEIENTRQGLARESAATSARRQLGNTTLAGEFSRDVWIIGWLDTLRRDLRYAFRALRRSPGFALVAILSLALGIGANTAIFTLINIAMLKPLPVSHPEELLALTWNYGGTSKESTDFPNALWEQIRDHQDVFAGLSLYGPSPTGGDLSAGGEARPVTIGLVSGGFFSTLGVRPAAGRLLTGDDDQRGCPAVAVITYAFWQSEYGGSENVVGKSVAISGRPFQIVGVTEREFFGVEFGYSVPIWAPRCAGGPALRLIIGRPKRGVTLEQIRAHLAALAPAILDATVPANQSAEAVAQYRRTKFGVKPFSKGIQFLQHVYGEALWILMAVVGIVLLIACANVANLLLARATVRQREIALRIALGAGRRRLLRQLFTESLLLSLFGTAAGVLFATWGSRVLVGLLSSPRRLGLSLDLAPDGRVLAFTIAVTALTATLFGLAPAWRAVRVEPRAAMKPAGRGITEGHSRFRLGKALVIVQIALSLMSLAGAGLLLGSWRRLVAVDPGFRSDDVLLVSVHPRATTDDSSGLTSRHILERLRAIPGVGAASAIWHAPLRPHPWRFPIDVVGFVPAPGGDASVHANEVSDGYFTTMGIPLLAGRDFHSGDTPASPKVAIVSEEMARKFFGGDSAIGRHFRIPFGEFDTRLGPPVEIIGIAANSKQSTLGESIQPIVYFAISQAKQFPPFKFAVRSERPVAALMPSVKAAIAEINPRFSVELTTMKRQLDESLRLPRTLGLLSGFFGALALLLATMGLYGIMAYTVARRRNEIGVRIALGATRARVIRMVLGDVGRMVVAGVALGVLLSLAATRLVADFLYGVEPNDPATLVLSALTLAAVAIGAAMIPARRAARLDPMASLRED
jgi:predicted permease